MFCTTNIFPGMKNVSTFGRNELYNLKSKNGISICFISFSATQTADLCLIFKSDAISRHLTTPEQTGLPAEKAGLPVVGRRGAFLFLDPRRQRALDLRRPIGAHLWRCHQWHPTKVRSKGGSASARPLRMPANLTGHKPPPANSPSREPSASRVFSGGSWRRNLNWKWANTLPSQSVLRLGRGTSQLLLRHTGGACDPNMWTQCCKSHILRSPPLLVFRHIHSCQK